MFPLHPVPRHSHSAFISIAVLTFLLILIVGVGYAGALFLKPQFAARTASLSPTPAIVPVTPPKIQRTSYVACGCGCCGGAAAKKQCLYRGKGDNLEAIIAEDEKARGNKQCALMGCGLGIEYSYCD